MHSIGSSSDGSEAIAGLTFGVTGGLLLLFGGMVSLVGAADSAPQEAPTRESNGSGATSP